MAEPRTWRRYALQFPEDHQASAGDFYGIYEHPLPTRMHGDGPMRLIELVEDPDGQYYGWVDTGDTEVCMVQSREVLFAIQFPYGVDAEVESGKGEVVRLTVTDLGVADEDPA